MPKMSVCRAEAFIIGCLRYLITIILHHAHPASGPQMSRQPLNLAVSKFVGHYQPSSLSYVLAALRDLLHGLRLS